MQKLLCIACVGSLFVVGCGSEEDGGNGVDPQMPALDPGPGAFAMDFETSGEFVSAMSEIGPSDASNSPHGDIRIWYSANIESLLGLGAFSAVPEGTVAIKEQDQTDPPDGEPDQLMIMIKLAAGSSPETGDWLFEQRDPMTGDLVTSSDDDAAFRSTCNGCHQGFPATDRLAGMQVQ